MRLLLIGMGKMGKALTQLAIDQGHTVAAQIDTHHTWEQCTTTDVDVALEFTTPAVGASHIRQCLQRGIPVVSGTTGLQEMLPDLIAYCNQQAGVFFYSTNYSLGMQLFLRINRYAATLLQQQGYQVALEETHHVSKHDAPSGSALTLAASILDAYPTLKSWSLDPTVSDALPIKAIRTEQIAFDHQVIYPGRYDTITLQHSAHDRKVFAQGALDVAHWVVRSQQQGFLTMDDFLSSTLPDLF